MRRCRRAWPPTAAIVLAMSLLAPAAVGADPVLLDVSARGLVPIEEVSRLEIAGLPGDIGVRIGKPDEIRFVAVDGADRSVEVSLEIWRDGRTLRLLPPADFDGRALRFEATVGPGVDVEVRDSGPTVQLMNIDGAIAVSGSNLELHATGIGGDVELELRDAELRLDGAGGSLSLDVEGVRGSATRVQGGATGRAVESDLEIGGFRDEVDLDVDRTRLTVTQVGAPLSVEAIGGSLALDTVEAGARLELEATPLRLQGVKGKFEIRTDDVVQFLDCSADLHVNGYGASVRGKGNGGLLEVKTDDGSVQVESIKGAVRVEGDNLDVDLTEVGGETWIFTTSSRIRAENLSAYLRLQNDYGDVVIGGAAAKVEAVVLDGDVRIDRQNGPVLLRAEGDVVDIAWVSLAWTEDSKVVNERGDVVIHLPQQGGARVEAYAGYGGVESEVDGIEVAPDGASASGQLRRQSKPRLEIRAEGSVRIVPVAAGAPTEE